MNTLRSTVATLIRSRIALLVMASILILPMLFVQPAQSFVLTGQEWVGNNVSYRTNPSFPTALGGSQSQQVEALRCAAETWTFHAESNFNFIYAGNTTISSSSANGIHVAYYTPNNSGGPGIAVTTSWWNGFNNYTDFDIAFFGGYMNQFGNPVSLSWNGVGDPVGNEDDIIAVAAHEFGHALGLDHSTSNQATMFATTIGVAGRSLHADDEAGVLDLYGTSAGVSQDPVINNISPPSGDPMGGNEVVITGMNFTWETDTTLRIDGTTLPRSQYNLENCSTIRILNMPAHNPGLVSIQIVNELGNTTLSQAYEYESAGPPQLSTVSPNAGPTSGGTPIIITGSNFSNDAMVFIGVNLLQNTVVQSSTQITGETPAGSVGPTFVTISQNSGSDSLMGGFTYSTNVIAIENASTSPGANNFPVRVLATNDLDLSGYSFGIDFDPTHLELVELSVVGTAADSAEFVTQFVDNDPGPGGGFGTLGVVLDFSPPIQDIIAPGSGNHLANLIFNLSAAAPTGIPLGLDILDTLGSPPVDIAFSDPMGTSLTPQVVPGFISVLAGVTFIRGDSNGDLALDISDAIRTLSFLFSGVSADCLDALDANDDGAADIADAVYFLAYLFSSGAPPPAPFPNPGLDPTSDALDCLP